MLARTAYGYDSASRLSSVSDGTNTATYSYLANAPMVSQIAFTRNGTNRMTQVYDLMNRLTRIASAPSWPPDSPAPSAISSSYGYNSANQRVRSTAQDGSYWVYAYDSLGQVTSGNKYWSDGTPVAGQQFEYGFDDIGNRTQTKSGGDETGANLRAASYTAGV